MSVVEADDRAVGHGHWLRFDTLQKALEYGEALWYAPVDWKGPGWYGVYERYDCCGEYEAQLVSAPVLRVIYEREAMKLTNKIAEIEALASV